MIATWFGGFLTPIKVHPVKGLCPDYDIIEYFQSDSVCILISTDKFIYPYFLFFYLMHISGWLSQMISTYNEIFLEMKWSI